MLDYLLKHSGIATSIFEILAALVGIICYNKYKASAARYLIFFLIYTVIIDFMGSYPTRLKELDLYYLIENTLIEKNYWWYVIFW
ncbi:MAG: hypothetical protein AAFX55_15625, partial [Bacteroidota bacterium]